MKQVTIATAQMTCGWDVQANIKQAEAWVREAARKGANIVLLPELFERVYFCQRQQESFRQFASSVDQNKAVLHFQKIAQELKVVLPVSFFEQAGPVSYNSMAMIDADGSLLGVYRKSHIPDGPGYCEKFYFSPGDTGFQVWKTQYGCIGVGICWDQWFPEVARIMTLKGAQLLLYPTAIGSEPYDAGIDSRAHWQRVQQGHAAANVIPVVASNRTGKEQVDGSTIDFYGHSFITNETGALIQEIPQSEVGYVMHSFDLNKIDQMRQEWGLFRDRRPEQYSIIMTKDGINPVR